MEVRDDQLKRRQLTGLIEGLVCDPHTGTGVPPATVAEWTLQGDGNKDFYDGPSDHCRILTSYEYSRVFCSIPRRWL
jgi:hypothetical protein